jgi:hypothetical protein
MSDAAVLSRTASLGWVSHPLTLTLLAGLGLVYLLRRPAPHPRVRPAAHAPGAGHAPALPGAAHASLRGERRTDGYTPHVAGVVRDYKHAAVPKPGRGSPLAPALARAVDAAGSLPPMAPGDTMPHDSQEVKEMLAHVVRRINVRQPALALELVSFDNVVKTVDGYKTIRYVADANVYAKTKNVASKITVAVDLTATGKMYIRDLAVHGATKDTAWVTPSNGPGTEERYASFEPALRL